MSDLVKAFKRGEPMIWFTGSALGVSILMIAGLVVVILVNGLSFFWPKPLEQVTLKDGGVFLGEVTNREAIPNPGHPDHLQKHRILLRVGNRDLYGFDFKWLNEDEIAKRELPREAYFIERREYGALIGTPVAVKQGERTLAADTAAAREGPSRADREGRARPPRDRDDREARDRRHQLPHREGAAREPPAGPGRAQRARSRPVAGAGSGREDDRRAAGPVPGQDHGAGGPDGESGHQLRELPDRRRRHEGPALARHLPRLSGERARLVWPPRRLLRPALGVRDRQPPRVEHRGRDLPGHLRHRDDGDPDEHRGGSARRAGRALPARVRQAGAARAHRADRGQQPGRGSLDRVRRLRAGLLRVLRRRRHRPAVLPRGAARRPPSAPAGSCGRRSRSPCSRSRS